MYDHEQLFKIASHNFWFILSAPDAILTYLYIAFTWLNKFSCTLANPYNKRTVDDSQFSGKKPEETVPLHRFFSTSALCNKGGGFYSPRLLWLKFFQVPTKFIRPERERLWGGCTVHKRYFNEGCLCARGYKRDLFTMQVITVSPKWIDQKRHDTVLLFHFHYISRQNVKTVPSYQSPWSVFKLTRRIHGIRIKVNFCPLDPLLCIQRRKIDRPVRIYLLAEKNKFSACEYVVGTSPYGTLRE